MLHGERQTFYSFLFKTEPHVFESGASIDKRKYSCSKSLYNSVRRGDIGLVKLLLQYRADPNTNSFGSVAVVYVAAGRRNSVKHSWVTVQIQMKDVL